MPSGSFLATKFYMQERESKLPPHRCRHVPEWQRSWISSGHWRRKDWLPSQHFKWEKFTLAGQGFLVYTFKIDVQVSGTSISRPTIVILVQKKKNLLNHLGNSTLLGSVNYKCPKKCCNEHATKGGRNFEFCLFQSVHFEPALIGWRQTTWMRHTICQRPHTESTLWLKWTRKGHFLNRHNSKFCPWAMPHPQSSPPTSETTICTQYEMPRLPGPTCDSKALNCKEPSLTYTKKWQNYEMQAGALSTGAWHV